MTTSTPTTEITFSPYQTNVLNWVKTGRGSAIVVAVAGSGKTFVIENALPLIPEHQFVQMFAFNTTIAKELTARIEKLKDRTGRDFRRVRASTFHSAGFGAICKRLDKPARSINVDANKCRRLAEEQMDEAQLAMYGEFVCKLVGLAKGEGIGVLTENTAAEWVKLIVHHDLLLDSEGATEERAIELAMDLLVRSNRAAEQAAYIDYDDQLYLPLLWRCRFFQVDFILVDEAQDTNPVRRALARAILKPNGRAMFVGDPKQAIYGFTGASHDALDIIKREFRAVEMPLSVCYRCAKSVVEKAQDIVPYIEAHDGAPEGVVESMDVNEALKILGSHDAILCRLTAPLIQTAFGLIARGVGCVVLGRDIGAGLISLIGKMKAKNIDALQTKLEAYLEREVKKFMAKNQESKAEQVTDRVNCIMTIIDNLSENDRTVPALIRQIEGMFSDSNGVLTLATVHKAKGKEWQQVAILKPEAMPSKWARQDWQYAQEMNLMYVAYTRAQEHLIFLTGNMK